MIRVLGWNFWRADCLERSLTSVVRASNQVLSKSILMFRLDILSSFHICLWVLWLIFGTRSPTLGIQELLTIGLSHRLIRYSFIQFCQNLSRSVPPFIHFSRSLAALRPTTFFICGCSGSLCTPLVSKSEQESVLPPCPSTHSIDFTRETWCTSATCLWCKSRSSGNIQPQHWQGRWESQVSALTTEGRDLTKPDNKSSILWKFQPSTPIISGVECWGEKNLVYFFFYLFSYIFLPDSGTLIYKLFGSW